jgi:hypothetical protein
MGVRKEHDAYELSTISLDFNAVAFAAGPHDPAAQKNVLTPACQEPWIIYLRRIDLTAAYIQLFNEF